MVAGEKELFDRPYAVCVEAEVGLRAGLRSDYRRGVDKAVQVVYRP